MLREPESTICSILNIRCGGIGSIVDAADYYKRRLEQMRELLDRRKGRALVLESEALIENSKSTLAEITRYLGLAVPLAENYKQFPMTGKSKFGDPSEWIRKGTIVRTRGGDKVKLGANSELARAHEVYEDFCNYARTAAERTISRRRSESVFGALSAATG
jgi:hypothetical protein